MAEEKKYQGYGYHGGGRPKADKTKSKNLNIRLTEEEINTIKQKAAAENKTVSEYVKEKCL